MAANTLLVNSIQVEVIPANCVMYSNGRGGLRPFQVELKLDRAEAKNIGLDMRLLLIKHHKQIVYMVLDL